MILKDDKSYKLLVTTALESTWGSSEDLLFLGDWCKKFSRQNIFQKRKYQTVDYHWLDRKKITNDHEYLEELYERVLISLALHLNQTHNLEKDIRYWRIIIGPWLLSYIAVMWDRWESVLSLNKINYIEMRAIRHHQAREIPLDNDHYIQLIGSDLWNHSIFNQILEEMEIPNFSFIDSFEVLNKPSNLPKTKKVPFSYKIKYFIDSVLFALTKKNSTNRYFFTKTYFPLSVINRISFNLGFVAGFDTYFDNKFKYKIPHKRSEDCLSNFQVINKFESFLVKNILNDIPSAHVENFSTLQLAQKDIFNAKVIFTANAHFNDELFKVWVAEQTSNGAHFVVSSHGGALYPLYSVFNHQELIADTRIIWGKEWMHNQLRMPPNKLDFKIKKYCKDGDITFIGYDTLRYAYRLISAPIGPLVLDSYKHSTHLIRKLYKELNGLIKIRPQKYGAHWETKKRYEADFDESIISKHKNMADVFKKSRLIICSYPQTTFSESIFSGVPTILYMKSELWETQEIYKELLTDMKRVKIFHDNAESAFSHINSIYHNPMDWWESKETKEVRNEFNKMCLTSSNDIITEWVNFFKKL
jgi:putative transferase (TIGR04331 family)